MRKLIYKGAMPTCEVVDNKAGSPTLGRRYEFARDKGTEVPDHVADDLLLRGPDFAADKEKENK
jgi:hypothetical protein